jgi:phosphoribosylaminoimidazolecarboxamide formyltransferase / IMP cyclohydrolase
MSTALLSVSDKRGLLEMARALHELGWDMLASGGTAKALRQVDLPVTDVADYTGSPEVLGGRVKTLHPAVHGGILSRSTDADFADLERISARQIDLVAVNLYPFQQTVLRTDVSLEDAIENIDIGGVALIRAAAKNFTRVVVLTDPADYDPVVHELQEKGAVSQETRHHLARKAFDHTSAYDAAIAAYLGGRGATPADEINLRLYPVSTLRYGENPHQDATLYAYNPDAGPLGGLVLQGKALSYNNILDLDAAWRAVVSFEKPTICIVKHLSPCGIASSDGLQDAFSKALACDPVSAFGGVVAANRLYDEDAALALGDLFVECIAAPGFSRRALEALGQRKNLRLVSMPDVKVEPPFELRSVNQGILRQMLDLGDPAGAEWRVVTTRQPSSEEWQSLRFAWKACQHVKSNAIVFAQGEATVGIGGGQPNRVDCVRIAAQRAGERARGAVMASDAFFPFPDSVEEAAKAGITAIIAPGGSVRDTEAIAAAEASRIAMVFTGIRHFRH